MKKVLVIGATGCMGSHLVPLLLEKGYAVDGVTLDDACSNKANLRYIKANAMEMNVLRELLQNDYGGIVDFMHYSDVEAFKNRSAFILSRCKHYIFVSSYRAYADCNGRIVENSPRLTEKYANDEFLMRNDTYGVRKCLCEDVLRNSEYKNYTIVRPVVVYGENRYPITTWSGNTVPFRARQKKKLLLPLDAKNKSAALIYAGDIAKEFVSVLFRAESFGEVYTFGNTELLTWGDVAEICEKVCKLECVWIPTQEFAKMATDNAEPIPQSMITMLYYDRLFNRRVDVTKITTLARLGKDAFFPFEKGLQVCYARFPNNYVATEWERVLDGYMDAYIEKQGL